MGLLDFFSDPFGIGSALSVGASVVNNERNIAMQRETNELNAQLAREQMQNQIDMQRENNQFNHDEALAAFQRSAEWNDESAVTGRRIAAGLNPAGGSGVPSSGFSAPAASSANSGISPTMTHLDSPHSNLMVDFSAMASAIKNVADAKKAGVDTSYLQKTLDTRIKTAIALQEGEEWKAALAGVQANVEALYARGIKEKELELLTKNIANADQDYWLKDAQIAVSNAQEILNRAQAHKYGKESELIVKEIQNYITNMNSLINLRNAQAEQSRASAVESTANAETENVLRPLRKERAGYENSILFDEKEVSNSTVLSRIEMVMNDSELSSMVNDQQRQKITKAIKDNDYYELRMLIGTLPYAVAAKILQPSASVVKGFMK